MKSQQLKPLIVFEQLKDDEEYTFKYLKENLAKKISSDEIKADIRPAAYINRRLYCENGIIQSRFTSTIVSELVEAAQTPEELLAIAKEYGRELTPDQLEAVAGGLSPHHPQPKSW